jgi:hypothetical protein
MAGIFDTILQNFKSAQKNTQRYISLGFVFTLLCFFYVVEPFFLYTSHQRNAEKLLKETVTGLDLLGGKLDEIRHVNGQTRRSMSGIHERIRAYPDHLNQEVLPQIYEHFYGVSRGYQQTNYAIQQVQQQVQQAGQSGTVTVPAHINEFSDAVNWYVQNWFQQIVDDLNTGIVDPILQLDLFETGEESRELELLTRQAVEDINSHLVTIDPEFWHTYQEGKVETVGELQRVIDHAFMPVTVRLDDMHQEISGRIDSLQASRAILRADSISIHENLSLLNDRIKSMSSPFGPIPLRATELTALFPVLLVLIVLFTVMSLAKSSRLYAELWDQYRTDRKKSAREFLLLTDCWYLPPYRSRLPPVLLILFTLFMVLIYLYSIYLIWSEPGLFSFPGIGEETFRRSLFNTAYITGLLVLFFAVWYGYSKIKEVPDLHP